MQTPGAPATPQPAVPALPPVDFWQAAWGVVVAPRSTLAYVCRERKIAWGAWLLVFFTLAGAFVALVVPQPEVERLLERLSPNLGRQFRAGYALVTLFTTPATHLSIVLGYHIVARWFKGQGSFWGLFAGYMAATIPGALAIPFQFLPIVAGGAGTVIAVLVGSGTWVWVLVLAFFAVKLNYNLTAGRAVAVYLIPWAALVGTIVIVIVFVIIAAVLALGAIG